MTTTLKVLLGIIIGAVLLAIAGGGMLVGTSQNASAPAPKIVTKTRLVEKTPQVCYSAVQGLQHVIKLESAAATVGFQGVADNDPSEVARGSAKLSVVSDVYKRIMPQVLACAAR
jgi:hypothetical protein